MINIIKKNKLPVTVAVIYLVLAIVQTDKAATAFSNSLYYFVEMLEILPVIFLLTVSIEVLVPKEWIMKNFGENSGAIGYILSLVLGSISAGPIYAAFPICKTLLKKGASIGNVVIILSAWAVVKVPMLANEAKFLGSKFMGVRWILTVIMIFIMGFIMNKLVKSKDIPSEDLSNKAPLTISEDYCTGCGLCAKSAPEIFKMEGKKAKVINTNFKKHSEVVKHLVLKCPVKAIVINDKINK